jgi:hypothetical protein
MQVCQRLAPIPEDAIFEDPKSVNRDKYYQKLFKGKCKRPKRCVKSVYDTQAQWNSEWMQSIRSLPSKVRLLRNFDPKIIIDRIESVVLLGLVVREVQTPIGVAAALAQALRSNMSSSITTEVLDRLQPYIQSTFGYDVFDAQAGEIPTDCDWLMSLKSISTNWDKCRSFAGFEKISNLISMSAAIGLCDLANFKIEANGIKLFSVGAYKKHLNASDFVGAVLDTVVYFVEGAYKSFQQGNLEPFIYTSVAAKEFDLAYFDVQEMFVHAKASNLSKHALSYKGEKKVRSDNDFSCILDEVIDMAETIYRNASASWEKSVTGTKLSNLRQMRADWQTIRVNGDLREAPFGIYLFGESAVGKSTVAAYIMRCALAAADADVSDDRIISIKESDKFDSNIKSHINGFFIDDLGNTKPDFFEKSPCEKLIDIMNNMPTYANMAEAEMKGKVSIEPKVVVGTSNVKLAALARKFSMLPFSIVRRMNFHFTIRVREEFWLSKEQHTLDSKKVFAKYGKDQAVIPDLWHIDIYHPNESRKPDMLELKHSDVSIHFAIRYLNKTVREHFELQKKLIESTKNLGEKLKFCKLCKLPATLCSCNDDDSVVDQLQEIAADIQCHNCDCDDDDSLNGEQSGWESFDDGLSESSAERDLVDVADSVESTRSSPSPPPAPPDMTTIQSVSQLGSTALNQFRVVKNQVSDRASLIKHRARDSIQDGFTQCSDYLSSIDNRNWNWLNYVPDCVFYSSAFRWGYLLTRRREFVRYELRVRRFTQLWFLFVVSCFFSGMSYTCKFGLLATLLPSLLVYVSMIYYWKRRCEIELANSRNYTPILFERLRAVDARVLCGTSLAVAGLYYFVRLYRRSSKLASQGNLLARTTDEIAERDSEENPWANAVVNELHVSVSCKTTTFDAMCLKAPKSLCHVVITADGKIVECDAWFACSNVAILPAHILRGKTECKALFTKYDVTQNGATFRCPLSLSTTVFIPNTDLCITYVPNGGTWPDLKDWLPEKLLPSSGGLLVHRKSNGGLSTSKLYATSKNVETTAGKFSGHSYSLEFPTFNGLCMSLVLLDARFPVIGGFHLGGKEGKAEGCSGTLLRSELDTALAILSQVSGVLLSCDSGTMNTEKYDKKFYQGPDIHQKSPVNFLPKGNNLQYFGQVTGRASYTKSDVVPTVISEAVEEVTGVGREHGPPKFHRWKNWQASLEHSSTPSPGVEGVLVCQAVEDYIDPLLKTLLDPLLPWRTEVRPLTQMETICGRDGVRYLKKMVPNTSVGFPLGGPKVDFLTYENPEDFPCFACPASLDPMFWDEAQNMKGKYLRGERAYPVFKACLKDEPTELTKEKVRVFQAAELAFQLLVRMYFLPIARFLSMNPILAECAVGINAHGPEWVQLIHEHILKYGDGRILAGDYSKYDLRMPAQLTLAAFSIYIKIAEASGNYSEDDLKVMRGIATDNVYPMSAYNGDYVMLTGTVPSGTNLTVYINNTANSLFHRCAYFDILSKAGIKPPPYREVVASTFYGDDALSSVKPGYELFNHISYAAWLKERGVVFTMPDKESEPTEYMYLEDVDFLKRRDSYIPELGMTIGALDEKSIFKSLHAVLQSKSMNPKDLAAQNIDGALREWFAHGRSVYEKRRQQMCEVAELTGITHLTKELNITFDDRVQAYMEKYFKTSSEPSDD